VPASILPQRAPPGYRGRPCLTPGHSPGERRTARPSPPFASLSARYDIAPAPRPISPWERSPERREGG